MSKKSKNPPFIRLPYAVYDCPEFARLSGTDIAVLLLVIRKHNGSNNGNISLGTREIAGRCGCGQTSAVRSLKALQDAGLVSATYKGHFVPDIGRPNAASRWRLTWLPIDKLQAKPKLTLVKKAAH
jgi:hypothetical protein